MTGTVARYAVRALLGVVGTALVIGVGLLAFATQARAELTDGLRDVGPTLLLLEQGAGEGREARTLMINGAAVTLASGTEPTSLDEVLDGAAERCGGSDDGLFDLTFDDRTVRDGFIGCFAGLGSLGPDDVIALADAFGERGDLSAFGAFQFTYARATQTGTHSVTAVIDSVDIGGMFPEGRDVPGADPAGIPRPAGARRLLSAMQVDSPYHVAVYAGARGTRASVRDQLIASMTAGGWTVHRGADTDSKTRLFALRGGVQAVIVLRGETDDVTATIATGL